MDYKEYKGYTPDYIDRLLPNQVFLFGRVSLNTRFSDKDVWLTRENLAKMQLSGYTDTSRRGSRWTMNNHWGLHLHCWQLFLVNMMWMGLLALSCLSDSEFR